MSLQESQLGGQTSGGMCAVIKALVLAAAAGFAAAFIAWLINRIRHPAWLTTGRTIVLISVGVLVVAAIGLAQGDSVGLHKRPATDEPRASDRRNAEERLIGELDPGGTFSRLKQILGGQEPDRLTNLGEGFVAQFEREWEYIHTLVDRDGNIDSIAIIAKVEDFHPEGLGAWPSPFGKTIGQYEDEIAALVTGLISSCGAKRSIYVEIVDTDLVPAAYRFQSVAFGNMNWGPIDCYSRDLEFNCYPDETAVKFDFASCLSTTPWDGSSGKKFRYETPVWAVVVTAPNHHITLDMLRLPDEIGV